MSSVMDLAYGSYVVSATLFSGDRRNQATQPVKLDERKESAHENLFAKMLDTEISYFAKR